MGSPSHRAIFHHFNWIAISLSSTSLSQSDVHHITEMVFFFHVNIWLDYRELYFCEIKACIYNCFKVMCIIFIIYSFCNLTYICLTGSKLYSFYDASVSVDLEPNVLILNGEHRSLIIV